MVAAPRSFFTQWSGNRVHRQHTQRWHKRGLTRLRQHRFDDVRRQDLVGRRSHGERQYRDATAFFMGFQSMNLFRLHTFRRRVGFTLIELMIAVTIGLLLTAVVAKLFVGSSATYQTTDEISRMQENIRFAFQLMSRTVHQAAYRSSPNSFAN